MENRYKHFFQTLIGYFLGNVFTKLISFILLPLYTRLIAPEAYGVYGVNMTIVQLTVPIVFVCIWNAVFRFASEEDSDEKRYEVISTGLPVMWISSIICVAVLFFVNFICDLQNPALVAFYAIANGFQYYYGYVARSMKDNKIFIISGCVNSTINLLINWIGIAYFHQGIEVLYYSYIIGTAVQIFLIEYKYRTLRHYKSTYVKKLRLNAFLKFSGPLALNSMMQWLLTGLTQLMIANMLGTYFNGLYSVAIKFATLVSFVESIFEYAWLELAYDIARTRNSVSAYRRTVNVLFLVMMFGSSVVMLGIKIIFPYFIAEAYRECLSAIPFIVVYTSANALASFSASIYMSYKKVNMITVSSLIAGGSNFILLIVLIPIWGFQGAMSALAASSVLMMLIRLIGLQKKYGIGVDIFTASYVVLLLLSCMFFYATDSVIVDIAVIVIYTIVFLFSSRKLYFKYMVVRNQ